MNSYTIVLLCGLIVMTCFLVFQNFSYYTLCKASEDLHDIVVYDAMVSSVNVASNHDPIVALVTLSEAIAKLKTLMFVRGQSSYIIEKTLIVLLHQKKALTRIYVKPNHPLYESMDS